MRGVGDELKEFKGCGAEGRGLGVLRLYGFGQQLGSDALTRWCLRAEGPKG